MGSRRIGFDAILIAVVMVLVTIGIRIAPVPARSAGLAPAGHAQQRARAAPGADVCVGFAALTSIAAGCQAASSVSVSGSTLTLYASAPPGAATTQAAADVLAAEQLAFNRVRDQLGKFTLRFIKLGSAKPSDNARSAIEDTSSIAYLGELDPGVSSDSLGITNAQDLLQVTPTDTAAALTQVTAAVPNSPNRYYESLGSYGRTFARVVPTTAFEAKAQVQEMQALHVSKLYVSSDASQYGRTIAQAVRTDAQASSITIAASASGADAVFYGGVSEGAAAKVFNAAALATPAVKLFGCRRSTPRRSLPTWRRPPDMCTSHRPGS